MKKRLDLEDGKSSRSKKPKDKSSKRLKKPEPWDDPVNPLTSAPFSPRYTSILESRKKLPVWPARHAFTSQIKDHAVVIVVGETGSGKTTQLPQFAALSSLLAEEVGQPGSQVCCTQPRRVAATSVAARVAQEMDVSLGDAVGYSVRFDSKVGPYTRLKYLTDGMLVREAMADPLLRNYGVILLDEVHERTASSDELLGFLKTVVLPQRNAAYFPASPNGAGPLAQQNGLQTSAEVDTSDLPPLRIVVMSATLDVEKLRVYFPHAPTLSIPGRTYPVTVRYLPEGTEDYVEDAVSTVLRIHEMNPAASIAPQEGDRLPLPSPPGFLGDILVFLTGEEEIENVCARLKDDGPKNLVVLPLYSTLHPREQAKVFEPVPGGRRKVVVATNIAETSLTIDGIIYVIDCGFEKQKQYCPRSRQDSLLVTPISQASAVQRAGRAGRTRPGMCFRLYPESAFNQLLAQTPPEVLRSNLNSIVLTLVRLGVENLARFDFMDPPPPQSMMRALELLYNIGALDDQAKLTSHGKKIVEFPLDPQLAAMLIHSGYGTMCHGRVIPPGVLPSGQTNSKSGVPLPVVCSDEIVTLAAMLSVPPVLLTGGKKNQRAASTAHGQFQYADSDHLTLLKVYRAYVEQGGTAERNSQEVSTWCWDNWIHERHLKLAVSVRSQLVNVMMRVGVPYGSCPPGLHFSATVRKAICFGFFMQAAKHQSKRYYRTVKDNQLATIHKSSTVSSHTPEWVIFNEYVMTTENFLRTVTTVELQWLVDVAPQYYVPSDFPADIAKAIQFVASSSAVSR